MTQQEKPQNIGYLSGLKQAIVILELIGKGLSEDQIVEIADGGWRIVRIWISFLKDLKWIEVQEHEMKITKEGMASIARYQSLRKDCSRDTSSA